MLAQLLRLLAGREQGLSLSEISRALEAQPSAVRSMIDLLVKKGKLLEIGPDGKYCGGCGLQSDCDLLAVHGKRYILPPSFGDEEPASRSAPAQPDSA